MFALLRRSVQAQGLHTRGWVRTAALRCTTIRMQSSGTTNWRTAKTTAPTATRAIKGATATATGAGPRSDRAAPPDTAPTVSQVIGPVGRDLLERISKPLEQNDFAAVSEMIRAYHASNPSDAAKYQYVTVCEQILADAVMECRVRPKDGLAEAAVESTIRNQINRLCWLIDSLYSEQLISTGTTGQYEWTITAWTGVIRRLSQNGEFGAALAYWAQLRARKITPTHDTVRVMLELQSECLRNIKRWEQDSLILSDTQRSIISMIETLPPHPIEWYRRMSLSGERSFFLYAIEWYAKRHIETVPLSFVEAPYTLHPDPHAADIVTDSSADWPASPHLIHMYETYRELFTRNLVPETFVFSKMIEALARSGNSRSIVLLYREIQRYHKNAPANVSEVTANMISLHMAGCVRTGNTVGLERALNELERSRDRQFNRALITAAFGQLLQTHKPELIRRIPEAFDVMWPYFRSFNLRPDKPLFTAVISAHIALGEDPITGPGVKRIQSLAEEYTIAAEAARSGASAEQVAANIKSLGGAESLLRSYRNATQAVVTAAKADQYDLMIQRLNEFDQSYPLRLWVGPKAVGPLIDRTVPFNAVLDALGRMYTKHSNHPHPEVTIRRLITIWEWLKTGSVTPTAPTAPAAPGSPPAPVTASNVTRRVLLFALRKSTRRWATNATNKLLSSIPPREADPTARMLTEDEFAVMSDFMAWAKNEQNLDDQLTRRSN